MGVSTVNRVWATMRKPFSSIPVRGLFYFVGGSPSGVFVKVSPTQYANTVQDHQDNPHFEFRCVQGKGSGNPSSGDFIWFTGTRTSVNRAAKVIEVNPSNVIMEANHGADGC